MKTDQGVKVKTEDAANDVVPGGISESHRAFHKRHVNPDGSIRETKGHSKYDAARKAHARDGELIEPPTIRFKEGVLVEKPAHDAGDKPRDLPALPSPKSLAQPACYKRAVAALEACEDAYEVKRMGDLYKRIGAAFRDSQDQTIHIAAWRLGLIAYRRLGTLLAQVPRARGANQGLKNKPRSDQTKVGRRAAAEEHDISEYVQKTALRIAALPMRVFKKYLARNGAESYERIAQMGKIFTRRKTRACDLKAALRRGHGAGTKPWPAHQALAKGWVRDFDDFRFFVLDPMEKRGPKIALGVHEWGPEEAAKLGRDIDDMIEAFRKFRKMLPTWDGESYFTDWTEIMDYPEY